MKTRSELESEISQAIIRFKKEYMGRGPLSVRTYLLEDMALVRLQCVPTAAEQKLGQVEERNRGRDLIKQVRLELIELRRPLLEAVVQAILKAGVVSLHTDISTRTGESVILFTVDREPEFSAP